MEKFLGRFAPHAYALMRFMVGWMFAMHGTRKLMNFPPGPARSGPMEPLTLLAGWIELVGGSMIALGLFAGWAALIASGTMAVAYFKAHAPGGFWPIVNKGELAVVYCFIFLYIATRGSGIWSIESLFRKPRRT